MSRVQICILFVIFGACILLSKSCKIDNEPKAPAIQKVILPRRLLSDEPPVTEAEAKQFAVEFERTIAEQDQANAEKIIRLDELIERSISDFKPSYEFLSEIRALSKDGFSGIVLRKLNEGGEYKLLRIKIVDGCPRPLFRLLAPEGGVNYHEFVLARDESGKVAVKDIYIAFAGAYLTETFRLSILPKLKQVKDPMIRLTKSEKSYLENLSKISILVDSLKSKSNYQRALEAFRSLPVETQRIKYVHLCAIQIAMQVAEEEYIAELERFRNNHPDDPACDVLSVDYFFLKMKYKQAIASIDRLQLWTGGDDYLQSLKSIIVAESDLKPKK